MANLKRCGSRAARKPCDHCGRQGDLYWAHDLSREGSGFHCKTCNVTAPRILVDSSGNPHRDSCSGKGGAGDKANVIVDGVEWMPITPTDSWKCTQRTCPSATTTGDYMQLAKASWKPADSGNSAGACSSCFSKMRGETDEKPLEEAIVKATVEAGGAKDALQPLRDLLGISQAEVTEMVRKAVAEIQVGIKVVVHDARTGEVKDLEGVQHRLVPDLIRGANLRHHQMLVGPIGSSKSHLAKSITQDALGLPFSFRCLTPDTGVHVFEGFIDANGVYRRTSFRDRYEHGGGFSFEEIDFGNGGVLGFMNTALAQGWYEFPDGPIEMHADFMAWATANTYGNGPDPKHIGRQPIDFATKDRFDVVTVDYDEALEDALTAATGYDQYHKVIKVCRRLRKSAADRQLPIGYGVRSMIGISEILREGGAWDYAVDVRLRRGVTEIDWKKLTDGVSVSLA